jgi:putative lipoprotein
MLSFRPLLAALTLVTGLVLVGCSHADKPKRPAGPGVGGTVMYITNVQLPPDAVFEIKLVELTREGVSGQVVAEENYARPVTMPLEFFLRLPHHAINKRLGYGMEAKIVAGGRVLFATSRPVPVLTRGNPESTEIVVEPVK